MWVGATILATWSDGHGPYRTGRTCERRSVYVFYHRVARVLGVASERDGMMEPSDRRRLAKALARVVVHELVHRVAPDLPHADSG